MPYPCNNPPEGPELSGVVPRTWGRKGCCGKTKDADMAEVPGRKKMDKEEIRYVWDGLEWGKEVYPGWRGGWRTLNPCLAMARRLGVIVVKAGSHWRLLRKDLDFDGREGISARDLEATSYWEFPNTTCSRTQAKLRLTLSQRMPPLQHTHMNMCAHTHTHACTHTLTPIRDPACVFLFHQL